MLKKAISIIVVIAMLICGAVLPSQDAQVAKRVSIDKTAKVTVGETVKIKLKNNKKKVTWKITTDNGKKIIKITKKAKTYVKIKGKKKGTAKVQAVIGKKKYTCKVTVTAKKKAEATEVPTSTSTPSAKPTETPVPTTSVSPTEAPELTESVSPTKTPESTASVSPTETPKSTLVPTVTTSPTGTPESTVTTSPTSTPTETPEPVVTTSPTSTPTETPEPVVTTSPTSTPTETPEPVVTTSPTKEPTETSEVLPEGFDITATDINVKVTAVGEYINWDGVSNVSQFVDGSGRYCFAYDSGDYVFIVKTENGSIVGDSICLQKLHSIFGGVICDDAGNYYLVTGETNTGDDTDQDTVFISKYDANGNLVETVGDNGSSSLAYYYNSGFYTKTPFSSGSCDVAINGNILTVHYARKMYSDHQSNSVFTINVETMEKVNIGLVYQSHCFAQRAIPYQNGFVYAGEGDCYNRAFTINVANEVNGQNKESDIFHFWVKENTLNNWDMGTLNNNFAHMGGLAVVGGTNVALLGTSVRELSAEAESQSEQLFIQIFNPLGDLASESSYVTTGVRSGVGGPNGDEAVVDYGVKWLSDFDTDTTISHPQIVSDNNDTIIVLFEKYVNNSYKGVYHMKLSADGTIQKDISCLSENAYLNPCRMPVYSDGKIYWTANKYTDKNSAYVYSFNIE